MRRPGLQGRSAQEEEAERGGERHWPWGGDWSLF